MFYEKTLLKIELLSIFDEFEPELRNVLINYAKGLRDAQHALSKDLNS
jgi:hypothetical protein